MGSGDLVYLPTSGQQLPPSAQPVDYKDVPIIVIAVFEFSLIAVLAYFSKNVAITSSLVTFMCILISLTSWLNSIFQDHWKALHFSYNYFDHGYNFIFFHWTLPFLAAVCGFICQMVMDIFKILNRPKIIYYDEDQPPEEAN